MRPPDGDRYVLPTVLVFAGSLTTAVAGTQELVIASGPALYGYGHLPFVGGGLVVASAWVLVSRRWVRGLLAVGAGSTLAWLVAQIAFVDTGRGFTPTLAAKSVAVGCALTSLGGLVALALAVRS